jgi:hypothetical protein
LKDITAISTVSTVKIGSEGRLTRGTKHSELIAHEKLTALNNPVALASRLLGAQGIHGTPKLALKLDRANRITESDLKLNCHPEVLAAQSHVFKALSARRNRYSQTEENSASANNCKVFHNSLIIDKITPKITRHSGAAE